MSRAMRLTPAQAQRLFVPLVVMTMSGVLSLVFTAMNAGVDIGFFSLWLRQWAIAFAVALPTALLLVPRIRNFLDRLTVAEASSVGGREGFGRSTV
jgi:hypothetical protein